MTAAEVEVLQVMDEYMIRATRKLGLVPYRCGRCEQIRGDVEARPHGTLCPVCQVDGWVSSAFRAAHAGGAR